jgi:hypothetical protein
MNLTSSIRIRLALPSRSAQIAIAPGPAITQTARTDKLARTGMKARRIARSAMEARTEWFHLSCKRFRTSVPDTCGMCHGDVVEQYRASVHGQALGRGISEAPLCTDCHGEHKIIKH